MKEKIKPMRIGVVNIYLKDGSNLTYALSQFSDLKVVEQVTKLSALVTSSVLDNELLQSVSYGTFTNGSTEPDEFCVLYTAPLQTIDEEDLIKKAWSIIEESINNKQEGEN
jgi:hypothetical protein